ncbi:MAG TPA: ornithine cyclodeaminase family protein [Pyrinomonadaceae bacterium]|jgi:alanine dehydrogenase|nr:ornithine cyclodeaminase family protein [Pyrinomonadaceae bacterium]
MKPDGTLLLTGRDVAALLSIEECMVAVEHAFKLYGEGKTQPPGILGVHARDGGFHIKAGLLELHRSYFAAKVNANFPENGKRYGLPTIQGVVVLCDAENGYPLALIDSIEITIQRTGAATGVAAKHLARPESKAVTICCCGNQGGISLRALTRVLPIEKVWAYDKDQGQAQRLASELAPELGVDIEIVADLETAIRQSDVCVTCTPSKQPFLKEAFVAPGTFIAAVGADNPEKQELEPALLGRNKLVVDVLEQGATIGELHHALDAGVITRDDVYGELGDVIAGIKPGRISSDEIIIFDSTGMALQDVVTAAAVYEKALTKGTGLLIDFAQ